MSRAATITDSFYLGEDVSITVTVTDDAGSAVDITGMSISYLVWSGTNAAVITKTVGSGIALTTPASGILTITIADTDTDAIAPGRYNHELKITDNGAGLEEVIMQGLGALTLLDSKHKGS
jgi:hypothetical protein